MMERVVEDAIAVYIGRWMGRFLPCILVTCDFDFDFHIRNVCDGLWHTNIASQL